MSIRKTTKVSLVVIIGLVVLVAQFTLYATAPRSLGVIDSMKTYNNPGSITAVINTPRMGTGGLQSTFLNSWKCPDGPMTPYMAINQCKDGRRVFRTHSFDSGYSDIKGYLDFKRHRHPYGSCLITTAIRSPETWFGSMYLQQAKQHWLPKEEMIQNYRKFLAAGEFNALYNAIPALLQAFDAGTLAQQMKIMDDNGGYSFISAPENSMLAGCDLLFLQMEQSERWPEIFKALDPAIKPIRGNSRLDDYPAYADQINAIAEYKLTSREKIKIYNTENHPFLKEWFDVYGYMDYVTGAYVTDHISTDRRLNLLKGPQDSEVSNIKVTAVMGDMGTEGLSSTLTKNHGCHESGLSVKDTVVLDCENDHKIIQSQTFNVGAKAIQEQRKENPDGQCLIITAIRSPATWFASKFLELHASYSRDGWKGNTRNVIKQNKKFLRRRGLQQPSFGSAIPDLLNEFSGGSLKEQYEIMDVNGGYSMLGPAPQDSSVAGCKLLFLRMEESDEWQTILKNVDPTLEFKRVVSMVLDESSEFTRHLKHIKTAIEYEMTVQEKEYIYSGGNSFVKEWFDLYDYMNDGIENRAVA